MSNLLQEAIERIQRHCKLVDACYDCELRDDTGDDCYLTLKRPQEWEINDVPERLFK